MLDLSYIANAPCKWPPVTRPAISVATKLAMYTVLCVAMDFLSMTMAACSAVLSRIQENQ